jgi:predicted transcriptional regulator
MNVSVKTTHKATNTKKKEVPMPVAAIPKGRTVRPGRERVLVEFSDNLLKRTDEAASRMEKNRSELIRTAVEQLLNGMEKEKFEKELAAAYVANAQMNLELAEEFAHVDSEGF